MRKGEKTMSEYIIENLTKEKLTLWNQVTLNGVQMICRDNTDIVVFNEKDCDKALHLIGRK